MDTEPGEKELVAYFPLCNYSYVDTEPGGRNWWRTAFLDFLLCNYFYVDTEPGGKELVAYFPTCNHFYVDTKPGRKELVAYGVPGFSSV